MKRVIAGLAFIGLVSGCATQKPWFTEEQYMQTAQRWYVVNQCGRLGKMNPATAAKGLDYIKADNSKFQHYPQKVADYIMSFKDNPPSTSDEVCNQVAMTIEGRSKQIADDNKFRQDQLNEFNRQLSNQPKRTYCNQIGSQTMCSTY